ncbi:MAG: polysaccharide biosynthesis C-terminal domain-containing protein, partial [Methanobacterium sp.]
IILIKLISPNLIFIQTFQYSIIYLFVVIMYSITTTCGNIFTGLRKADMYLFQNILLTSRIIFLLPLISMGSLGIYSSMGLAYVFSSIFSLYSLEKLSGLNFRLDKRFIKNVFNFSFGNYLANVFDMLPILILPILALNLLGEAESAKCFIAFAIGNIVLIVPDALSMSVLVEGSHGENVRNNVKKAGVTIYTFLVPAVLFLYVFGTFILSFFGENYIEAYQLLRLLILSSFFVVVYTLYKSIMNVDLKVKSVVKIVFLRFILILGLSLIFIKEFGINGIGYAWISSHAMLCLVIIFGKYKNVNFKK